MGEHINDDGSVTANAAQRIADATCAYILSSPGIGTIENRIAFEAAQSALATQRSTYEARIAELERERDRLEHVIDRDRYVAAAGVASVMEAVRRREWLRDSRGSYAWDDEKYQEEFGFALDEIIESLVPLRKVAWDKSDCTKIEERVIAAREAAKEYLAKPIGPREAIAADFGIDPWQKRATAAEARLAEAVEVIRPFVRHGRALGAYSDDPGPYWIMDNTGHRDVPAEDFRRAARFIQETERGLS